MNRQPLITSTLDHVAIAVEDWARANRAIAGAHGASTLIDAVGGNQRISQYRFSNGAKLETLAVDEATRETSRLPGFLARYGETVHHVTLKVDDVPSCIAALAAAGYPLVGVDVNAPSRHEAYLPPTVTGTAPVQLLWLDVDDLSWAHRRGFAVIDGPGGPGLRQVVLPHHDLEAAEALWSDLGASTERRGDSLELTWSDSALTLALDLGASRPRAEWEDGSFLEWPGWRSS